MDHASWPDTWPLALCTALLVCGVVAAVHWPALSARAMTLDDQQYVTFNHLVRHPSWDSVARFFREVQRPSTVEGYYQPLTMTSLMLDWALGARVENLRQFHRTSLTLHVLNTALVILILHRLSQRVWPATLVGLLFGLHPMTVEPVVWITERKTLLAAFFALLAVLGYLSYVRRPSRWRYAAILLAFVLALLSKPTSTPLPVLLLLLDFWPLGRLSWRTAAEKVPLAVVAGVSAIITLISQSRAAGVTAPHEQSLSNIVLTICHNLVFYLHKMAWPANLTSYHPFPEPFNLTHPAVLAGVIGTLLLTAVLVVSLRWTRALLAGWLFFCVALTPTLGVIGFTYLIAADKYAYLPALGLLILLACGLTRLWSTRPAGVRRAAIVAGLLVLAAAEARATRRQIAYWRDTETLYLHMLSLAPQAGPLHDDYGNELTRQGRLDEAIQHFRLALKADPDSFRTHNNYGIALMEKGELGAARAHFEQAIRLNAGYGSAHNSLGTVLARQGKYNEAFPHFQRALELDPHMPDIHINLGNILAWRGEWQAAAEHFATAAHLKPELAAAHSALGIALARLGQLDRAAACFYEAIRLEPNDVDSYRHLGRVLLRQTKMDEAGAVFQAGLRIAPHDADLQRGLQDAQGRTDTRPSHPSNGAAGPAHDLPRRAGSEPRGSPSVEEFNQ